jgi:5-formyltetrahydrofolate cyclo-ligase
VHELQVHEDIPVAAHDVPLDVIVTPERVIRTETAAERPDGIDWDALADERVEEMPVLDAFESGEK